MIFNLCFDRFPRSYFNFLSLHDSLIYIRASISSFSNSFALKYFIWRYYNKKNEKAT